MPRKENNKKTIEKSPDALTHLVTPSERKPEEQSSSSSSSSSSTSDSRKRKQCSSGHGASSASNTKKRKHNKSEYIFAKKVNEYYYYNCKRCSSFSSYAKKNVKNHITEKHPDFKGYVDDEIERNIKKRNLDLYVVLVMFTTVSLYKNKRGVLTTFSPGDYFLRTLLTCNNLIFKEDRKEVSESELIKRTLGKKSVTLCLGSDNSIVFSVGSESSFRQMHPCLVYFSSPDETKIGKNFVFPQERVSLPDEGDQIVPDEETLRQKLSSKCCILITMKGKTYEIGTIKKFRENRLVYFISPDETQIGKNFIFPQERVSLPDEGDEFVPDEKTLRQKLSSKCCVLITMKGKTYEIGTKKNFRENRLVYFNSPDKEQVRKGFIFPKEGVSLPDEGDEFVPDEKTLRQKLCGKSCILITMKGKTYEIGTIKNFRANRLMYFSSSEKEQVKKGFIFPKEGVSLPDEGDEFVPDEKTLRQKLCGKLCILIKMKGKNYKIGKVNNFYLHRSRTTKPASSESVQSHSLSDADSSSSSSSDSRKQKRRSSGDGASSASDTKRRKHDKSEDTSMALPDEQNQRGSVFRRSRLNESASSESVQSHSFFGQKGSVNPNSSIEESRVQRSPGFFQQDLSSSSDSGSSATDEFLALYPPYSDSSDAPGQYDMNSDISSEECLFSEFDDNRNYHSDTDGLRDVSMSALGLLSEEDSLSSSPSPFQEGYPWESGFSR